MSLVSGPMEGFFLMSEVPLDIVQFWGLVEGMGYQLCEQARHPFRPPSLSNILEHSPPVHPKP